VRGRDEDAALADVLHDAGLHAGSAPELNQELEIGAPRSGELVLDSFGEGQGVLPPSVVVAVRFQVSRAQRSLDRLVIDPGGVSGKLL
jgi:hypothetical protein